jgi:regulator of sigma E protease
MYIILALLALGILIVVHELGHYVAARLSGVWVERFSIGFGPILLRKTKWDTEFCLSLVPLGGYAKLHRMFEEEEAVDGREHQAFYSKSYIKKLFMILAGVLFNMLFAVLILSFGYVVGYKAHDPVIYGVEGAALQAGFLKGDIISSINGKKIRAWDEFSATLTYDMKYPADVTALREGVPVALSYTPEFVESTDLFGDKIMLTESGMTVYIPPVIGHVTSGLPAEQSGMKEGDTILAVNGESIAVWSDVGKLIRSSGGEPITISALRNGEPITFELAAKSIGPENSYVIGIAPTDGGIILREWPWKAVYLGLKDSLAVTKLIYVGLGKLVTGKVSVDNLGGPIMIISEGSNSAKAGIAQYLFYIALISINLGVLNLLPIPVLDGGYAILFTFERLISRKIGRRIREASQMAGIFLLVMVMLFAMYNDILRYIK